VTVALWILTVGGLIVGCSLLTDWWRDFFGS
jgi:hypothetical protein